jgi:hypothetical protein
MDVLHSWEHIRCKLDTLCKLKNKFGDPPPSPLGEHLVALIGSF